MAGVSVRILLTLIGAAGLIISAFLNWINNVDGVNLDIRTLWRADLFNRSTNTFAETVGFAVIVVGLVAIIGLAPRSGWLTRLAGAVGIAGFILFVIEIYRSTRDLNVADIQTGAWIALAGSIIALIGGFFGTRTRVVTPAGAPAVVEEP